MRRRDFVVSCTAAASFNSLPEVLSGAQFSVVDPGPSLDGHAHLNSPRVADFVESKMGKRIVHPMRASDLVARLDADGIERALTLSTGYMFATDAFGSGTGGEEEHAQVRAENDFTAAEAAQYPDRLIPFFSLNPKRDYALDEMDRCLDGLGMRGMKLHFWNSLVNLREADQRRRVRRVFEHAASRRVPIVAHVFVGAIEAFGPDDIQRLAGELVLPFRGLRLSFAHLGGAGGFSPPVWKILESLVELFPPGGPAAEHTFVDMAAVLFAEATERIGPTSPEARQRMGELLEGWGVQRVLWGSDNIPRYLALSRGAWPLSDRAWNIVRQQRGDVFAG